MSGILLLLRRLAAAPQIKAPAPALAPGPGPQIDLGSLSVPASDIGETPVPGGGGPVSPAASPWPPATTLNSLLLPMLRWPFPTFCGSRNLPGTASSARRCLTCSVFLAPCSFRWGGGSRMLFPPPLPTVSLAGASGPNRGPGLSAFSRPQFSAGFLATLGLSRGRL